MTFSEDDVILGLHLSSAVASVEQHLQRKLITQTWKMWLDYWPTHIMTMFGDLQSVTHIKYTDIDGVQATFSSTLYDVDINSVPGRIVLKNGESWPNATLNAVNPIEIQFVTGYGAAPANIPDDIRNAILLTTDDLYENRGNIVVGVSSTLDVVELPGTARALLANHRVWDWIL